MDDNALPSGEILLECERLWIFAVLTAVGGFLGAYTYTLRGGVFCNAQTANLVMLSMALGNGNWGRAAYYLLPMGAYILGTVLSELLPTRVRRFHFLRWDSLLVGLEVLVTLLLGFIPESWPYQLCQLSINFICSMQYNTFRQAEHIPMATTFCTNHIRQLGIFLSKWLSHGSDPALHRRIFGHLLMLFAFSAGAAASAIACRLFNGRAIWGASALLLIVFIDLAHADRTKEKGLLELKPSGH